MLEKFLKNKAIGYYLVAVLTLLALVLAIVFFSSYSNPSIPEQMGNKAAGMAPETIGIFVVAGIVIEAVVLFAPEFRFFHFAAVVMFGLAIYKDVIIIADFIAGMANDVMYNGGNLGLNMFFIIALFIIEILAIVAGFVGFIKPVADEEEEDE